MSGTDAADFTVNLGNPADGACTTLTVALVPAGRCSIVVTLTASTLGSKSANLTVTSDDPRAADTMISLSANVVETVGQVETLEAPFSFVSDTCCGATLASNESCDIVVGFAPELLAAASALGGVLMLGMLGGLGRSRVRMALLVLLIAAGLLTLNACKKSGGSVDPIVYMDAFDIPSNSINQRGHFRVPAFVPERQFVEIARAIGVARELVRSCNATIVLHPLVWVTVQMQRENREVNGVFIGLRTPLICKTYDNPSPLNWMQLSLAALSSSNFSMHFCQFLPKLPLAANAVGVSHVQLL